MAVSDQIIQVLDALCEKLGLVVDWTGENVVPYIATLCSKLICYEIWTSAAYMVIAIVAGTSSIFVVKKMIPIFKVNLEKEKHTCDMGWEVGTVFACIGLALFYLMIISTFITQIMDIIQCVTFPEMFIFEYIQDLINTKS